VTLDLSAYRPTDPYLTHTDTRLQAPDQTARIVYITEAPTEWIDPNPTVTMTGVIEASQHAAEASAGRPPVSVWWFVLTMLGFVLMALGLFLNDTTSMYVWSEISR
jgi:hypothetical protein